MRDMHNGVDCVCSYELVLVPFASVVAIISQETSEIQCLAFAQY
jgi:hypothetical protein